MVIYIYREKFFRMLNSTTCINVIKIGKVVRFVYNFIILFKKKVVYFYANKIKRKSFKNKFPVPGIEPEPPGWKPGILATRPYRIILCPCEVSNKMQFLNTQFFIYILIFKFRWLFTKRMTSVISIILNKLIKSTFWIALPYTCYSCLVQFPRYLQKSLI